MVEVSLVSIKYDLFELFAFVDGFCLSVLAYVLYKCHSWIWWVEDPTEFVVTLFDRFCFLDTLYNFLLCRVVVEFVAFD